MTETALVAALIEYLVWHGWLVIRINSGAVSANYIDKRGQTRQRFYRFVKWFMLGRDPQTAGVADILAYRGPIRLAIEAKLPGNKPTAAQRDFLAAWTEAGGVAVVARSVEELAAAVEAVGVG